jgi:two-component system sensor histidine kinase KdpD
MPAGAAESAESVEGRIDGARFWFTLPVDTPPDAPDPMDEEAADDLGHNPGQSGSTPAGLDPHSNAHLDQLAKPTHE